MKNKTLKKLRRWLWVIVFILFALVVAGGLWIYYETLKPNVVLREGKDKAYLYISTGSSFEDVLYSLSENGFLKNKNSFIWTARQMKYAASVKPGKYLVRKDMNNRELVSLLRSGKQTPVRLIFNNIRTREELAKQVSEQLELKSAAMLNLMNDEEYVGQMGFDSENILTLFIPNTYEFYWNTSADKFIQRMKREYDMYWNERRITKAAELKLRPVQVSILASIVQQETTKEDEKSTIAGVYLNRLRKGMRLEADPTLVYASGDFSIRRVLKIHKAIDSPYNTYKYEGLPPGPICLPSPKSIDAVLNYSSHNYLYFCAREDFSGYHVFASSYIQHLVNAKRFQKALDKRGIKS